MNNLTPIIKDLFSDLNLLNALANYGREQVFATGAVVMEPNKTIRFVPIVLSGAIKVMRMDNEEHELFLYYITSGQTCALSLTCCNTTKSSEIKAVAEGDTVILAIPIDQHNKWVNEFTQWKEYVQKTYQQRFQELLNIIDDIAFKKMDERLLKYLIVKKQQLNSNELSVTHQEIAIELGTSREVISRLLKQLERKKLVELGRNVIYLRDDIGLI